MLNEIFKKEVMKAVSDNSVFVYEKNVVARVASANDISGVEKQFFVPSVDFVVKDGSGDKRLVNKKEFIKLYKPLKLSSLKQLKEKKEAVFTEGEELYAVQYTGEDVAVDNALLKKGDWMLSKSVTSPDSVVVVSDYEFTSTFKRVNKKNLGELFELNSMQILAQYREEPSQKLNLKDTLNKIQSITNQNDARVKRGLRISTL